MQSRPDQVLLVINSGSSSLKFSVCRLDDRLQVLFRGSLTAIGTTGCFRVSNSGNHVLHTQDILINDHEQALRVLMDWLAKQVPLLKIAIAGHRIVHGGLRFRDPVLVTDTVLDYLHALIPLAPNHQPTSLQGIAALQALQPGLPQVACFDTAFHHDRAQVEQQFALPPLPELADVRRYGFHGLSYEHIASVLPDHLGEKADGKIIVAHLGHGASLCALHKRHSVATTMTFTPLDGIPMGTRCGAMDPAVVLYLLLQGMKPDAVSDLLYFKSGLLGISGTSDDMARLLEQKTPPAALAIEQFIHHTVRAIGSLAAALEGLDALVFTAGIGENAAPVREAICKRCEWFGLELDMDANTSGRSCISKPGSLVQALVIPADEERMIAEFTWRIFKEDPVCRHPEEVPP